eukprot:1754968-Prymnesium_polylepis.1
MDAASERPNAALAAPWLPEVVAGSKSVATSGNAAGGSSRLGYGTPCSSAGRGRKKTPQCVANGRERL